MISPPNILCLSFKLILFYRLIPRVNFNNYDSCIDNIRIVNTIRRTNNGFSNICYLSFFILCHKRHSVKWIHKDISPYINELELCDIRKLVFNCFRSNSLRLFILHRNLLWSNWQFSSNLRMFCFWIFLCHLIIWSLYIGIYKPSDGSNNIFYYHILLFRSKCTLFNWHIKLFILFHPLLRSYNS